VKTINVPIIEWRIENLWNEEMEAVGPIFKRYQYQYAAYRDILVIFK